MEHWYALLNVLSRVPECCTSPPQIKQPLTKQQRMGDSFPWELFSRRVAVAFRYTITALRAQFRGINYTWARTLLGLFPGSPNMGEHSAYSSLVFDTMMESCTRYIEGQIGTSVHPGSQEPSSLLSTNSSSSGSVRTSMQGSSVESSPQLPPGRRPPRIPRGYRGGNDNRVPIRDANMHTTEELLFLDVAGRIEQNEHGEYQFRRIHTA